MGSWHGDARNNRELGRPRDTEEGQRPDAQEDPIHAIGIEDRCDEEIL
jgi:hypothetical protein